MKQETPQILNPNDIRTMRKDLKKLKDFKAPVMKTAPKPVVPPPPKLQIPVQQKPVAPPSQPAAKPPQAPSTPPSLNHKSFGGQSPRPQQPVIAQKMSLPANLPPSLKDALDTETHPASTPTPPSPQPEPVQPTPLQEPMAQAKTFMEEVEELAQQTTNNSL